jgi:hypothetical protein
MLEKLAVLLKTKVGLALVGALLLGGGGSAMAMANTNGQFFSHLVGAVTNTSPTHGDDSSATKTAKQGDQDNDDNAACANRTPGAKTTEAPDSDDNSTPGTHTDAEGTPGTHTESEGTPGTHTDTEGTPGAHTDAEGTPSATHTAGDDSHEGSETDCEGHDTSPTGAHTPEPTEHSDGTHTPEWTGTPQASPTGGHSGD